jgi:hypothetical protein
MSNIDNLKKSFQYYLNNKQDLMEKYYGKWIVIKDEKIISSYGTEKEAINKTIESGLKMGEFIVQVVLQNDGTQANFVSNVYV